MFQIFSKLVLRWLTKMCSSNLKSVWALARTTSDVSETLRLQPSLAKNGITIREFQRAIHMGTDRGGNVQRSTRKQIQKKSEKTLLGNTPYLAQLETPDAHKSNYFWNVALSSSQLVWPKFHQFLIRLAFQAVFELKTSAFFTTGAMFQIFSKLVLRWLTKMCSSNLKSVWALARTTSDVSETLRLQLLLAEVGITIRQFLHTIHMGTDRGGEYEEKY